MGTKLADQYSYLHFAVGVVVYFWGVSLKNWFIIHFIFEILENTEIGMQFINSTLGGYWPGGKTYPDSNINILGDNIFAVLGWLSAYYLDRLGSKYKWYDPHINR